MRLLIGIAVLLTVASCTTQRVKSDPMDILKPRKSRIKVKDTDKTVKPKKNGETPKDIKPIQVKKKKLPGPEPIVSYPKIPFVSNEIVTLKRQDMPPNAVPRDELDPARYDPKKPFEQRWEDIIKRVGATIHGEEEE